jgi:hypothetical protein
VPKSESFFDQSWTSTRTKTKLLLELSLKTRIPEDDLSNTIQPSPCSAAQRMSWAARRVTSRVEDRAYSLMDYSISTNLWLKESARKLFDDYNKIQTEKQGRTYIRPGYGTSKERLLLNYAPSPLACIYCNEIALTRGSDVFSERNGDLMIKCKFCDHTPGAYIAILHCINRA